MSHKRRNWFKIISYLVIVAILLGAAAVGGYQFYKDHRRKRLISHAQELLEKKDLRGASIDAHRVLQLHPEDVDASLVMAKIMEAVKPDEAIPWRRSILRQRPKDIDNAVALARIELQIGRTRAAQSLLETVKVEGANNADYQFVAGQTALASSNPKLAEEHLLKATQMDPKRKDCQFALAQAQLLLGDPEKRAQAREQLLKLSQEKEFKLTSLRLLMNNMVQNNEAGQALALSDKVVSDLDATFDDRLMRLDLAYRFRLPEYSSLLQTLQDESRDSSDSMVKMIAWLESHGMSMVAVEWARTMPRKIASEPRLKLVLAECHMRLGDWDEAKELMGGTDWGSEKYLALALQARLLRQERLQAKFQATWDSAVMEASKSQEQLVRLEQIAESWKWEPEAESVLWKLTERTAPPDWVFMTLQTRLLARGDSEGLRRLWQRKHELDPADVVITNNLALVYLLRGESKDAAHKLAAEVYESDKTNPYFVSTYAFSLYRQGKAQDALKLMNSLTPDQRKDPSTAVTYVAILVAANAKDQAREILPQIKSGNLLPEEKRLLDQSRNELGLPKS